MSSEPGKGRDEASQDDGVSDEEAVPLGRPGDMRSGTASDSGLTPRDGLDRPLPKRFYKSVAVSEVEDGFQPQLDGRRLNSPGKSPITVPTRVLAEAIAEEWDAQKDYVRPETMPQTRLANTAIDRVRGREDEVVTEIVKYAGTDLVCYRAEHPEPLVLRQAKAWDPVLAWADEALGVRLVSVPGVTFVAQAEDSLDAVRKVVTVHSDFELTAIHTMMTLSGSALLALGVAQRHLTPEAAWDLAHVDEDYQIEEWGFDADAQKRREFRLAEFTDSARMLEMLAGD